MLAKPPGDYSWVFDLISPDDVVRHDALTRHQELLAAVKEAQRWSNRVWAQAGRSAPTEPPFAAEWDQSRAAYEWNFDQTILGASGVFSSRTSDSASRLLRAPYLVLFLRWEASYPQEWGTRASGLCSQWTTKEVLLRGLNRDGVPEPVRPQIGDLIVAAVQRPYRCKDWMYARLVRHIVDPAFLASVDELHEADDPLVRLRARFIRRVAAHPRNAVTRTSWRRWLSTNAGT